jgi:hypothetical protein
MNYPYARIRFSVTSCVSPNFIQISHTNSLKLGNILQPKTLHIICIYEFSIMNWYQYLLLILLTLKA